MIVPRYYEDLSVLHENTMPARAYYIPASKRMDNLVEHRDESDRMQLLKDNFPEFLANVKESGDSSFKYLQNVYTCHDVQHQNVAIALALSDVIFEGKGVCRVHGGGFAGTIQAFVPNYLVSNYQEEMDKIFGKGSCEVLKIRKYGGIKVL